MKKMINVYGLHIFPAMCFGSIALLYSILLYIIRGNISILWGIWFCVICLIFLNSYKYMQIMKWNNEEIIIINKLWYIKTSIDIVNINNVKQVEYLANMNGGGTWFPFDTINFYMKDGSPSVGYSTLNCRLDLLREFVYFLESVKPKSLSKSAMGRMEIAYAKRAHKYENRTDDLEAKSR